MTGRWSSSTRVSQLPPGWKKLRARILRRDPTCSLRLPGCTQVSAEVDHIDDPFDHSDDNLQGICHSCHNVKTQGEATRARGAAKNRGRQRRRPAERHPGLID